MTIGRVLVTGGTGVLGRALVARLRGQAEVRVLSRRPSQQAGFVHGDLETGDGLAAAVDGVDVVAHCASAADYRRPQRDVTQTRRLLDSLAGTRPHMIYISIVGVERVRYGLFKAKLEAERHVAESGLPWTILRATEFHDLMLKFLIRMSRAPIAVVPRASFFQPVDVGEVADRMAELVQRPAAGRVAELGGPKVESMSDLMRTYLGRTHRRRPMIKVPLRGRLAAGFGADGEHLTEGDRGTTTFDGYLRTRLNIDGVTKDPYTH